MWMIYLTVTILSVIQIHCAAGCTIQSATSPTASSLIVKWNPVSGATTYRLELRVINSTNIAAVIATVNSPSTQKQVYGLRPGNPYEVTLKALSFFTIITTCKFKSMTVPDIVQFTYAEALTSSTIRFEWDNIVGVVNYTLHGKQVPVSSSTFVQVFSSSSGEVNNLAPSTSYECYIIASNDAGSGAAGPTRTITTLIPPPANVSATSAEKSTVLVTWEARDGVLMYQVTVTDTDPSHDPVISKTSETSLIISNLEPCSNYTLGVSSLNAFSIPGEPNQVSHITSSINPVTTITKVYSCATATVTVTWDMVFGANSYRADVTDGNGESLNCTSTSNNCDISALKCGEKYTVHVTAISNDCHSTYTLPDKFDTVPCAPANPTTEYTCFKNAINYKWEPTNNTKFYMAQSTDQNGIVKPCMTKANYCYFTDMQCGNNYTFTVKAVSSDCNSEVTEPRSVQTGPCEPANIQTTVECTSGTLTTTWDAAAGAQSYKVRNLGNDKSYNCSTSNNSCIIEDVLCGEHFTVWVSATNEACTTEEVLGEVAQTGPCPPTNVSVSNDCSPDTGTVKWTQSKGVVFYIVIAEDSTGKEYSFFSLESELNMTDLACGATYDVIVMGNNFKCNSSSTDSISFQTAPCPPTNVVGERNCTNKEALITWDHQATGSYTAIIEDKQNGDKLNCTSNNEKSCIISSPPCGKTYSVTVTYDFGNCSSASTAVTMDSGPCPPQNVNATLQCGSKTANVTWDQRPYDEEYTVSAIQQSDGAESYCNSTSSNCEFNNLPCGETFNFTVEALSNGCYGQASSSVSTKTEPCVPANLSATYTVGVAQVTWEGAKAFNDACDGGVTSEQIQQKTEPCPPTNVQANMESFFLNENNHNASCQAASTESSCEVTGLECGTVYTVCAVAKGNPIDSSPSNEKSVTTEPCQPSNINVTVDCEDKVATVSWQPSQGAQSYVTELRTSDHSHVCHSNNSSCQPSHLHCGEEYNVSVTAVGESCNTTGRMASNVYTEPCEVKGVSVNYTVGNALVQWNGAEGATSFSVEAVSDQGDSLGCNSSTTQCNVSGLQCSKLYNVTVSAYNQACDSQGVKSDPEPFITAPCYPKNISVQVNCSSDGEATLSWTADAGANVSVTSVVGGNPTTLCSTQQNSCVVTSLSCGQTYSLNVTATNDQCSVTASTRPSLNTRPCPPQNVNATLQCGSKTANVTWDQRPYDEEYTVSAIQQSDGAESYCNSTSSNCEFNNLPCGETFNFTVEALSNGCYGQASSSVSTKTEPCVPANLSATYTVGVAQVTWEGAKDHSHVCHSNNSSCQPSHLHCGEEYNVSVTAVGESCNTTGRMASNVYTEPCEVKGVSVNYTVGNALVQWNGAEGATSFSVEAVSDQGDSLGCNSSTTQCNVSGLQCSKLYNVTVSAYNQACDSQGVKSDPEPFITEPCPPSNVQATVSCETMEATINWNQSNFAEGYVARINSTEGSSRYCSAARTDTSCVISDLVCGLVYSASVIATGNQYNSSESTAITFSSAPCYPKNISVQVNCSSDGEATLSWTADAGANVSVTSVVGGNPTTLCSTQQNSCVVTSLSCGQTYSLNVTATNDQCSVTASTRPSLNTRPCPPQNVNATLQCGSKIANVTWDQRPYDEEYTVSAIQQSDGAESYCNSTSSNCEFNNLPCGETFNFTVKALSNGCYGQASSSVSTKTEPCQPEILDSIATCQSEDVKIFWKSASGAQDYIVKATGDLGPMCDSPKSSPSYVKTTPCIPQNVVVKEQCTSNLVSWSPSNGTTGYNATATSLGGQVLICITNVTSCTWDNLQCGEQYNVTVEAYDDSCTSLPSDTAVIHMSPCVPQNLVPSVDCNSEVVSLTWSQCLNTLQYNVTAQADSKVVTITVSQTNASFLSLSCGKTYNLTVTPLNDECPATPATTTAQTWPCSVTGVSTSYDCLGTTTVTWQTSAGADNYTATMISDSGLSYNCTSQSTSCPVSQLPCGQNFSVSVTASNAACTVTSTEPIHQITAPCDPMNLQTVMNCAMDSAAVSWNASMGADNYTVTGQSSAHNVSSRDIACSSAQTQAQTLDTAPCPPENVDAIIDCETNDLNVTWASSAQAQRYLVSVTAQSGGSNETCNTTNTFCTFSNVTCGNTFVAQVISVRDSCQSQPSLTASVVSKPCRPKVPDIDKSCRDAQVSWTLSPVADMYCVVAIVDDGHTHTCNTTFDNCTLSPLHCGQHYSVTVTASNENCSSLPSPEATLYTGPCKPENVSVAYDCRGPSALLTWNENNNAVGYYASAVDDNGNMLNCYNALPNCSFKGLQCERKYNFTVMATDGTCNSSYSDPVDSVGAVSCPPENITVQLLPQMDDNQILFVSWSSTSCGSTEYSVSLRGNLLGDDQFRFDMSSYWISELYFELPLPCSSEYNATVESMNSAGTSGPSVTVAGTTAPCPPSSGSFIHSGSDVNVVWAASPLANTYTVYEISTLPRAALCTKNAPNCTISNHVPVNLVVTASNEGGESVETSITGAI
uniref:Fibronectin type-III domain-containing protein n=1 Tax=Knipowitschia caucasica TaxID=637954 RepID=A0AAV2JWT6_KNICA